jgi:hypothetical protein
LETQAIDGLLIIGGWMAYKAIYQLHHERDRYPAFKIPMICLPASIDNNLPGSELSVGADTALNVIVERARPDQAVGHGGAALLRGRDHGSLLRLSGADERLWPAAPSASICTRKASPSRTCKPMSKA